MYALIMTVLCSTISIILECVLQKRMQDAKLDDNQAFLFQESAEVMNFALGFLVGVSWSTFLQSLVFRNDKASTRLTLTLTYTIILVVIHGALKAIIMTHFPKALKAKLISLPESKQAPRLRKFALGAFAMAALASGADVELT